MTNPLGTQHPLDIAVFECIAAHGIEAVTMERVAQRVGCPHTTFYRRYTSWAVLLSGVHGRAAKLIGWWAPRSEGDLRFELEWWWATMMEFFASDWGRAFLAIRAAVASRSGMHAVERRELALMPDVAKWLGVSHPLLRAVWSLALTAACPTLDENDRQTLRELVYAMLERQLTGPTEDDDLEIIALDSPM